MADAGAGAGAIGAGTAEATVYYHDESGLLRAATVRSADPAALLRFVRLYRRLERAYWARDARQRARCVPLSDVPGAAAGARARARRDPELDGLPWEGPRPTFDLFLGESPVWGGGESARAVTDDPYDPAAAGYADDPRRWRAGPARPAWRWAGPVEARPAAGEPGRVVLWCAGAPLHRDPIPAADAAAVAAGLARLAAEDPEAAAALPGSLACRFCGGAPLPGHAYCLGCDRSGQDHRIAPPTELDLKKRREGRRRYKKGKLRGGVGRE